MDPLQNFTSKTQPIVQLEKPASPVIMRTCWGNGKLDNEKGNEKLDKLMNLKGNEKLDKLMNLKGNEKLDKLPRQTKSPDNSYVLHMFNNNTSYVIQVI